MRPARFGLASLSLVATLIVSARAQAADPPKAPKETNIIPTRVQLVRLAEAELDAGRPAEAAMTATRVIEDRPQPTDGAAEVAAWEQAREVLVVARARAAHLIVGVTGGIGVTVDVDGTAVTRTSDLLVNPGEHVIAARSEGFDSAATTVRVKAGESRGVELTLVRKLAPSTSSETIVFPPRTMRAATATNNNVTTSLSDEPMQPQRAAAYATLGTGVASLIVGGAAAIVSFNKTNSLREQCVANVCPVSAVDELRSAQTWGKISTIAFVTSGVLLGTSGVLFFTSSGSSAKQQPSPSSSSSSSTGISLNVGPGSAFLSGKF